MKFKYIRVAIFILIATALSICLITYAINIEYKQIEYREIPEPIKEETPKIYIEGELTMKDKTEIGKFKVKYKSKNITSIIPPIISGHFDNFQIISIIVFIISLNIFFTSFLY